MIEVTHDQPQLWMHWHPSLKGNKMSFEGQVADALVAAVEANKTAVINVVNQSEGGLEAFLAKAIDGITVGNPLVSLILPAVKQAAVAELVKLEAQESGSVVFGAIDALLHAEATKLGG